jgi:pimeloyl-ACP methyl ester carboxylesterase
MSESGYVEVEGGQIFYVRDGEGPPVVLVHGGLSDLHIFDPQVAALSAVSTLVRLDLRGYGESSVPGPERYRHCDDVAAVVEALGFERAVIGGCSFGGAVTWTSRLPTQIGLWG